MSFSRRQILLAIHQAVNIASRSNVNRFFSKSAKLRENFRTCTNSVDVNEKISVQNVSTSCKESNKGYEKESPFTNVHEGVTDEIPSGQNLEIPVNIQKAEFKDFEGKDLSTIDNEKLPGPLDPFDICEEDLSHITPYPAPTFNFAAYADQSETIKQLVDLGVDLFKVEKRKDALKIILPLDFERDIKPYIKFLHDLGVPADYLGSYITRNPYIFKEDMDHLHTRIRYLKVHSFNEKMIQRIMIKAPAWLLFNTQEIDRRLGYFQNTFKLNGEGVRRVATECPAIVIAKMQYIRNNTFAIQEEMGFSLQQMRSIILKNPLIWKESTHCIVDSFDYLHNQMQISHAQIAKEPLVLLCRKKRLEHRHKFLELLNKAQYDPEKPLYVSLHALVTGTDVEFCLNVAKAPLETYNGFLKTF